MRRRSFRAGQLFGGLAYSSVHLRWAFPGLAEVELRPMGKQLPDSPLFGVPS